MMDMLKTILKLQREFQNKWGFHPHLKDICSAMAAEAMELWAISGGKWWSKKKHSKEKQVEELVDILHFFLTYMVERDISAQELFIAYKQKLAINHQRQVEGY